MNNKVLISNLTITTLFVVFILYIFNTFSKNNFYETPKIEYVQFKIDSLGYSQKDSLMLDINNKIQLVTKDIQKVEAVNDKRVEILGWSFAILSTFITIILGVNIFNHKSTIRDIVKQEINTNQEEITNKYHIINKDLETLSKQYSEELDKIKN